MSKKYKRLGRCVEWTGVIAGKGYGRIYVTRTRSVMAHRAIYEGCFGKIPDGLVIDHLCRKPNCINPRHMEIVTNKENVLRGVGISAMNAKKTHCKRGHELSGKNLIPRANGARVCRTCKNNIQKVYLHSLKSEVKP